ncbi:hypothetical protein WA158_001030 [Blastocystis sp. Blastoise]
MSSEQNESTPSVNVTLEENLRKFQEALSALTATFSQQGQEAINQINNLATSIDPSFHYDSSKILSENSGFPSAPKPKKTEYAVFYFNHGKCRYPLPVDVLRSHPGFLLTDIYNTHKDEAGSATGTKDEKGYFNVDQDEHYFPIIYSYLKGNAIDISKYNDEQQKKIVEEFDKFRLQLPTNLVPIKLKMRKNEGSA